MIFLKFIFFQMNYEILSNSETFAIFFINGKKNKVNQAWRAFIRISILFSFKVN